MSNEYQEPGTGCGLAFAAIVVLLLFGAFLLNDNSHAPSKPMSVPVLVADQSGQVHSEFHDALIQAHERCFHSLQEAPQLIVDYKGTGDITDLSVNVTEILSGLPFVVNLKVTPAKESTTRRIIHFRNYHFVKEETVIADLEDLSGKMSPEEKTEAFWFHLVQVETVQAEIMAAIRCLIDHHGLKAAYNEGLYASEEDRETLEIFTRTIMEIEGMLSGSGLRSGDIIEQSLEALTEDRQEKTSLTDRSSNIRSRGLILMAGPLIRLLADERLEAVLAFEDADALDAAGADFESDELFDPEADKVREDAMVKNLKEPVSVILLGGGHTLSDNIGPDVELIEVTVKAYRDIIGILGWSNQAESL